MKGDNMTKGREVTARDKVGADEVSAILERALAQPGVREMMSVFQRWESLREAVRPYGQAASGRTLVALADTSAPTELRTL
jgi:hypothetical protein